VRYQKNVRKLLIINKNEGPTMQIMTIMKNRTFFSLLACLMFCFVFSSCRIGCKRAEESILEKAIENAAGE